MKKISIAFIALFLLSNYGTMNAQINRTDKTKVVDILAQMPTSDLEHSDRVMEEIIGMGEKGIALFTDLLVPLGTGNDTQVRYALNSLAIYAGKFDADQASRVVVQNGLLNALANSTDQEISFYLLERLRFCATNSSIPTLSNYLSDEKLFDPALGVLTALGTDNAAAIILKEAEKGDGKQLPALVEALTTLEYLNAKQLMLKLAVHKESTIKKRALANLAVLGQLDSKSVFDQAVNSVAYKTDPTEAVASYLKFAKRLSQSGNAKTGSAIARELLEKCKESDQLHFRAAAINLLRNNEKQAITKLLLKEYQNPDLDYRGAVIATASNGLTTTEVSKWVKVYKKTPIAAKPLLIGLLQNRTAPDVFEKVLQPAVQDAADLVKIAGVKAMVYQKKSKALPVLISTLSQAMSPEVMNAVEGSLLRMCGTEDIDRLTNHLSSASDEGKEVLINVLAERRAVSKFDLISPYTAHQNTALSHAAFKALPSIASANKSEDLLQLLATVSGKENIELVQKAMLNVLNEEATSIHDKVLKAYDNFADKKRVLPLLTALNNEKALGFLVKSLKASEVDEQMAAIEALSNWKSDASISFLFNAVTQNSAKSVRELAFDKYLNKVRNAEATPDQKLLLVRKVMPYSQGVKQKINVIRSARTAKTFLSLVYVSEYLKDKELASIAAQTAITIALPTPGKNNGLYGDVVRKVLSDCMEVLTGPESQYTKIDVREYLGKMPKGKGFVSIFNGKDLTGWEGLVQNPIARAKMSKRQLANAQTAANEQMARDWFVADGYIQFKGEGYNNICTIKDYADFEMLVDWKITDLGDSGIYLRGTPQVQIWDIARVDAGAQVGSGGLYNNQKHERIPLMVADNPVNSWNTFRIKMVGERVTVYLNGHLVTDNVILENYWDRALPIFKKEAIELQAHGEDLGFRNIYVREISAGNELLSKEEQELGYVSLFNGKDLDQWIGNKTDYVVENEEIVVKPKQGGHGNLFTAEEYADFSFKFEFKLTPGANNGLGIHAPLEGDIAYVGKELQILDNTADIYANLEEWQYHGSVYGVLTAKKGFLNPVGEWNSEEVIVKGDAIKIILNGAVILEGNFKEASKNGTLDGQKHPGLDRNKGHIGFLGHGSELYFRNIRIKDLTK